MLTLCAQAVAEEKFKSAWMRTIHSATSSSLLSAAPLLLHTWQMLQLVLSVLQSAGCCFVSVLVWLTHICAKRQVLTWKDGAIVQYPPYPSQLTTQFLLRSFLWRSSPMPGRCNWNSVKIFTDSQYAEHYYICICMPISEILTNNQLPIMCSELLASTCSYNYENKEAWHLFALWNTSK